MNDIEVLEKYYKTTISATTDYIKRVSLLDYVDYIKMNKVLWKIIQPIEIKGKERYKWYINNEQRNDPLYAELYEVEYINEKSVELWGCWADLSCINKEFVTNPEFLEVSTDGMGIDFPPLDSILVSLTRIHNYIISKYNVDSDNHSNALWFDIDKSRLHVKDSEIKIRKFSDQYHLLKVIFRLSSEIGKEWFFSEIAELIDKENHNDKRYYNATYQINQKLKTFDIKDFFITTRQSLIISKKFLS